MACTELLEVIPAAIYWKLKDRQKSFVHLIKISFYIVFVLIKFINLMNSGYN